MTTELIRFYRKLICILAYGITSLVDLGFSHDGNGRMGFFVY